MITIITGTPGAGKTLYTIEKLLQPLVGTSIEYTDAAGEKVTAPRTIYTNINGLLLDHEKIDGGDNQGLRDWHQWAKPGSVIVFDEVQRHWVPRANGSKVPDDIQALETHRHMGVDFILITQNVLLVDRNIHALAGRHLHIRRVANMPMAIVYEWDHVSRGLLYAKSLTKSPWRYSKKVFDLYKSAEVHTKQPRKIPGLVWFIIAGILGLSILAPTTYARLSQRINGTPPQAQAQPKTPASGIGARPASASVASDDAQVQSEAMPEQPQPVFSGCAAIVNRCDCYDTAGTRVEMDMNYCVALTAKNMTVLGGGTLREHQTPLPRHESRQLVLTPPSRDYTLTDLRASLRPDPAYFRPIHPPTSSH
jgi:zona occludens toxin